MSNSFIDAYLAGSNLESESEIPADGRDFLRAAQDQMENSAETIRQRAEQGGPMDPTARRLTGTIMAVFWFAFLRHGDADEMLEWQYGATEHCADCQALNGQVHSRESWHEFMVSSSKFPRSVALECYGINCQCSLTPVEDQEERGNFV